MPSAPTPAEPTSTFLSAKPVWLAGKKNEMNVMAAFRAVFPAPARPGCTLSVACATVYRAYLNGRFVGHGPARGPHGHYRVDVWSLDALLQPGENVIALEVAGYNCNSYYTLDQPSFIQAEVIADGDVVAHTAVNDGGFTSKRLHERVQKVLRYSFQRPFTEVWRLRPGWDAWRLPGRTGFKDEDVAEQPAKWLIPRRVPHARFARRQPVAIAGQGKLQTGVAVERSWKDRSRTDIGPKMAGFPEAELESDPSLAWQAYLVQRGGGSPRAWKAGEKLALGEKSWRLLDLGLNLTGFIGLTVSCKRACTLFAVFDEILGTSGAGTGLIDFRRGGTVNVVSWELQPGEYELESFEPYTMRWLTLATLEGDAEISAVWLREYANDHVWEADFACDDPRLGEVFEAGRETFRQNAVDIFMDCPSRERAGWLCDSFFTGRVAMDLTGSAVIEQSFIENFLLPERFEHLPDGMLPMCYPADHRDGIFIPNWALWFVVELEEYLARTGDRALIDRAEKRVRELFAYFDKFANSDGLLEKLESWVFVEWSKANELVQDVSYASNMLFSGALAAAGRLWKDQGLIDRAERVAETVRQQSYDGEWFVDNAVRKDGKLVPSGERTEVCQYYAFFFNVSDPQRHPELARRLVKEFGPQRQAQGLHPKIHPCNAFIGTYLRLELLSRWGRSQQLLDECSGWFQEMAEKTGTLWENLGSYASCNHGFASHVCRALYRDALGVRELDPVNRRIRLRLAESKLTWCRGRIPTPDGPVSVSWRKDGAKVRWNATYPAGWTIEAKDAQGKELAPEA